MKPIREKIAEGVYLNSISTGKFKNELLSFSFLSKLSRESAAENALIPFVLTRGGNIHTTMRSLSEAEDELYAAGVSPVVTKREDLQFIQIEASFLSNAYAKDGEDILSGVLSLCREVILSPYTENGVFSEEYVRSEKQLMCDRIRALEDNKIQYALMRCEELMYEEAPAGICEMGKTEDVEKITAAALYARYRKFLLYPVEIYYVGSADVKALSKELRDMFSYRTTAAFSLKPSERNLPSAVVKEITEEKAVKQGKLSLGFTTDKTLFDKDYTSFALLCEIYGGSPSSKLFTNVREKLSLCYYCRSISRPLKGAMFVTAGIENDNYEIAKKEILAQLDAVKSGNISEEELSFAKKSLINAYREIFDNPYSMMGWYLPRRLCNRDDTPLEAADAVNSLTADDVKKAAEGIKLDTIYFLRGTQNDD